MRGIEQIPWLYDGMMAVMDATGLGRWRRKLVADVRGIAIEIGCGTGRNLPLYPPDATVIGVEPDWQALERARQRAPTVPLVMARAEALPFRTGSVDTVVSSLVFCSVPDPRRGLAEIRRVLAAGGELRMLEHVRHDKPAMGRLQDQIQPLWTWAAGGCHPNRETEAAVERAGFDIDASSRRARGVMRRFTARPKP